MASSPTIALRIPPRLLERLDQMAIEKYPTRDGGPNRSKMVLYFIEKGLEELSNPHPRSHNDSKTVSHNDMSGNSNTVSNAGLDDIKDFIQRQVAQQVQIQLQIQQQVQQQLEQTYSSQLDPTSEITELRQEVAEIKKF